MLCRRLPTVVLSRTSSHACSSSRHSSCRVIVMPTTSANRTGTTARASRRPPLASTPVVIFRRGVRARSTVVVMRRTLYVAGAEGLVATSAQRDHVESAGAARDVDVVADDDGMTAPLETD